MAAPLRRSGVSITATTAVTVLLAVAAFVHLYEEPTLMSRYGEEYAAYRRAVPAWLPRLHTFEKRPG